MSDCEGCRLNARADRGEEPWAVARLTTGYVHLNPTQYFRGAVFFSAKRCVRELCELDRPSRDAHLGEMAEVSAAMIAAFQPRKLNYEALGNTTPHLHWWLTPRYDTDPRPFAPIWEDLEFLRAVWTGSARPAPDERDQLRARLLDALKEREVAIEQTWDRRSA